MSFLNYYTESILDRPRVRLDPTVFELADDGFPPKLQPAIKNQILEDLLHFQRSIPVNKVLIIGSILTRNYSRDSDIDVTVEVNKEDIDQDTGILGIEALTQVLRSLNGKLATGTTHPINYYITTEFKEENADAIYDFDSDTWIKEPYDTNLEISDYMSKFEDLVSSVDISTGKLKRDVIDVQELENLDEDSIIDFHTILTRKLYEINKAVEDLVKFKKEIKTKRQDAFSKPMTPKQILSFSSKNRLPANVIYKLFQKYYYFDLINKLDQIIINKDKTNDYVDDIEDLLGYKESITFEDYNNLCEDFKRIKSGKFDWSKPSSHRKYKDRKFNFNKGMRGKTLTQVPNIYKKNKTHHELDLAGSVVDNAKQAPSGLWRLTPRQVREIALKYHHIPPNERDPIKHLGNTGIIVWRKGPKLFYLVKHHSLRKRKTRVF
jgi:predicted nucleotidyltransferase